MIRIAFDLAQMRPGCVLLQATFGCPSSVAHRFPVESWLLAPTADLKVYEVTEEQLDRLANGLEKVYKQREK